MTLASERSITNGIPAMHPSPSLNRQNASRCGRVQSGCGPQVENARSHLDVVSRRIGAPVTDDLPCGWSLSRREKTLLRAIDQKAKKTLGNLATVSTVVPAAFSS